jgi:phospholipid transport system substrate-binding protein
MKSYSVMPRLLALLLILILGLGQVGFATAEPSPQAMIENTTQQMQQALRANRQVLRADPSRLYSLVHQIVLPHFDFELMSQWVLGKYWRQVTPAQRTQFANEFRTLLVRSYAGALLEYTDEKIIFPSAPSPATGAQETTVHSVIQVKNGNPINLNYSLHFENGEWKVYDVTVDGVSLVINYRSTFTNKIRDGGMDALIQELRERNAKSKI